MADNEDRPGQVSETSRQAPEPVEDGGTTGTEGGGAGGWSRAERMKPETRKKEPDDRK